MHKRKHTHLDKQAIALAWHQTLTKQLKAALDDFRFYYDRFHYTKNLLFSKKIEDALLFDQEYKDRFIANFDRIDESIARIDELVAKFNHKLEDPRTQVVSPIEAQAIIDLDASLQDFATTFAVASRALFDYGNELQKNPRFKNRTDLVPSAHHAKTIAKHLVFVINDILPPDDPNPTPKPDK